jgi:phosphonoacetate hydrolase
MRRRYFLLAPALMAKAIAAPQRVVVIMLIDGFGLDYYDRSNMPNLKRMAKEGLFQAGEDMMPSVTNVNNASVVTGTFPAEHGITANFWRKPETREWSEMNTPDLLLRPTIFEHWANRGRKTAIVSAKAKVLSLCGRGAGIQMCAETPAPDAVAKIGPQADMYSPASNYWTMQAAIHALRQKVDLLYISTTDYMMHTYAPEDERSLEHLHRLDAYIAEVANAAPRMEFYVTADHGMNAMREAVDLDRVLARHSIDGETVPVIRDKHRVHHQNLGGSGYISLKNPADAARAAEVLRKTEGVEEVFRRDEAARLFHLAPKRIGDLMVLAQKGVAFGAREREREAVSVRSHGSRYESAVPIIAWGRKFEPGAYRYNLDITRNLEA